MWFWGVGTMSGFRGRRAVGAVSRDGGGASDAVADPTAGYAAIDALVALMVISITLILSIAAAATARSAATAAAVERAAGQRLRAVMAAAPRRLAAAEGVQGGYSWRVETLPEGAGAGGASFQPCRRRAQLKDLRSGRVWRLETTEFCAARGLS